MINLRSFLTSLWVNVKVTAGKAKAFIVDHQRYMEIDRNERCARECITRARNAYLSETMTSAPNTVTPRSIERLVRECHTQEEFMIGLENAGAGYDKLYCFLLFVAILEVYKSTEPPSLSSNTTLRLK